MTDADTMSFERARPRLVCVARRVLGDAGSRPNRSADRDSTAFLATTTTRLALNVGQSARVRRETAVAPQLIDAVDDDADPAIGAEQRQALEQYLAARITGSDRLEGDSRVRVAA